jgi:L-threonylcarbamoyladenylate synthase
VIKVDSCHPESALLQRAAKVIAKGGIVAYPTETVYGLGADAFNEVAVNRIYKAKGRAAKKPFSLIVDRIEAVARLAHKVTPVAQVLMEAFWPGPLTIVFQASRDIALAALCGGDTVALRVPDNPICLELLRQSSVPITSTSANRSGEVNPTTAQQVLATLGEQLDIIIDGGPSKSDIPSTVLDITVTPPVVRRVGAIDTAKIRQVIGEIVIA